jgi:hypothetical protein
LEGLPTGQTFQFRVSASNAIGSSNFSQPSAPLSADVIPAGPSSVVISAVAGQQGLANINWTAVPTPAGGSPVTGYEVVVFENGSPGPTIPRSANQTSLTNIAVTPGASYYARVTSKNNAQALDWNSTESGTFVAPGAPSQVTITSVSNSASGATTVTWNPASAAGSAGTLRYYLTRVSSLSSGCPSDYATHPASGALQASDGDKPPGSYFLAVIAVNDFGCSATVTEVKVVTPPTYTTIECVIVPFTVTSTVCSPTLAPNEAFVLKVSGLTLSPVPAGTVVYQLKIGNSNWLDLSLLDGYYVTAEYDSTRYAFNGINPGAGQNVVLRACLSVSNCSAPGSAVTLDIPTPTP